MRTAALRYAGPVLSMASVVVMLFSAALAQTPAQETSPATPAPAPAISVAQPTEPSGNNAPPPSTSLQESNAPVAQEPAPLEPAATDQAGMFVFKKRVEEVMLHATVFDAQRHLIPGLERGAFAVFEQGQPQTITSFRREDVPVAMGIVVDNSGSMRDKRVEVNRAILNLIRASNPLDEIFVVNFSQTYYLDQDFTSDVNLLQKALQQVSSTGSTALYDAIVASAVHLQNNPHLEKRVLLVITDGQDNMSQETLQEASRQLQHANGPTLYAVGLTGGGMQQTGRNALQQLALATGGVAYFPETLDQVENITRTVAHDIRSQYLIAYKPKNQNGKPSYQSVQVVAHAPAYGKLTVRTRDGYYAQGSAQ